MSWPSLRVDTERLLLNSILNRSGSHTLCSLPRGTALFQPPKGQGPAMDVRALSHRSHLLGQSKDPALLSLSWILIQSILELVALKPFFSRIPSHFSSFFPMPFSPGDRHPTSLGPLLSFCLLIVRSSPAFQNLCSFKTCAILPGEAQSSWPSLMPLRAYSAATSRWLAQNQICGVINIHRQIVWF